MILGIKIDKTYHPIKDVNGFYFEDGFCIVHHGKIECIFKADQVAFAVQSEPFDRAKMIPFIMGDHDKKEMCREFEMRNYAFKDKI